jgi:hypothetical protein
MKKEVISVILILFSILFISEFVNATEGIYYITENSDNSKNIWMMNEDSSLKKQVDFETGKDKYHLDVSPTRKYWKPKQRQSIQVRC